MHHYTHEEIDGATRASLNGFARSAKIHGCSKMKVNELRDALRKQLPPRQGTSPGLFVELCAGTAALSLRLHREQAKPPVSRMGSKTGYANTILHELGLYPGLKAERYLWCEPDAGVRLLLHAYTDRALAQAAAEIIRSWKDEEPRALWERLRAEGPAKCPEGLSAREVAKWAFVGNASYRKGDPSSGYNPKRAEEQPPHATGGRQPGLLEALPPRFSRLGSIPALITDDARPLEPVDLPPGTVAYMDPPYQGTTPYAHLLPREDVVSMARKWADAGALVCISEAEPIPELMAEGWHAVDITGERVGQKRTFSKQQREFLTLSRRPQTRASP
jgi:hypothetical protein